MHIAVNTRHLHARLEGVGTVTDEVMRRIVLTHPQDRFDYYFDQHVEDRFRHGPHVRTFRFMPPTRLPFLIRYWLDKRVGPHVARQNAHVFFSPDGFIPLGLRVPKVSMVHDVAFLRHPEMLQPRIRNFYATWMPRYLAYTDHIITVSEFSKQELIEGYALPAAKISVVHNGINSVFTPLPESEKSVVRAKWTKHNPYILYLGAIHPRKNLMTLLRAFETFKTSHPSEHVLVLAGRPSWHTRELTEAIRHSPVRESILLPGYVTSEDAVGLIASADVMVYPSLYEGFGLPVLESMACGVPVITSHAASLPEIAGEAAILWDPLDVPGLSRHLHQLLNNPQLRDEWVRKGLEWSAFFSWDRAASHIYEILQNIALKK